MTKRNRSARSTGFPLLKLFVTYAKDHKSEASVHTYRAAIRELLRFLGIDPRRRHQAEAALRDLDTTAALGYKNWSRERPGLKCVGDGKRAAATTNLRLVVLKRFYRLAQAQGLSRLNPFESISRIRGPIKRPTNAFPKDKVRDIVEGCTVLKRRALLAALIAGALRKSEAAKLTLGDVGESDGIVFLVLRATKNGDNAVQPIAPWAARHVLAWRDERRKAGASDADFLFVRRRHEPMSKGSILEACKRACKRVGLDPRLYCAHSCRATGVTMALLQGIDRKKVKDYGRFKSYEMVDRYDKRATPLSEHAGLELKL